MRSVWRCGENVLNKEHVFARLVVCPGLFGQLGPIQQYHKLCRAESKTQHMLSKVSMGTKCLNLEIIPRDSLIFEEIYHMFIRSESSIDENPKVFNIVFPL